MSTPDPRTPCPDDADSRLLAALRLLEEAAERADAVAPDPSRVAGHLAGVGDETVLREAAAHPSVRRLLADIVSVAPGAEADVADPTEAGGTVSGFTLSADATARVLAAFDASEFVKPPASIGFEGARPSGDPLVASTPRARASTVSVRPPGAEVPEGGVLRLVRRRAWQAAAAVLVLLVPAVVLSVGGGLAEAAPSLAIEGVDRVGADGAVETEGPRRLQIGDTVTGHFGERLALRLSGGGRMVLPGQDVVRVACEGSRCQRALLRLDHGEVVLAAVGVGGLGEPVVREPVDRNPVSLRLPGGGRFDLMAGAARVTREDTDRLVVVLRDDAAAVWTSAEGLARDLRGAGAYVLEGRDVLPGSGAVTTGTATAGGPPPASRVDADASLRGLFRDLELFGIARSESVVERRVGARRWRIVEDPAPPVGAPVAPLAGVRRTDDSGVPAIRLDLPSGGRSRLAWEPDEAALLSRRLVVHVRMAPGGGTTAGAPSSGTTVRVELEGVPGAFAERKIPGDAGREAVELEVKVPAGWAQSRQDPEEVLVLGFTSTSGPGTVWFESVSFDASEVADSRGSGAGGSGAGGTDASRTDASRTDDRAAGRREE